MPSPYLAERVLVPEAPADLVRTLSVLRRGASDPTVRIVASPGRARVLLTARVPETTGHGVGAVIDQSPLPGRHGAPTPGRGASETTPRGAHPLRVRAWGQDPEEVRAFLAGTPRLLGLEDDWSGFRASPEYQRLPEALRAGLRLRPGLRLPATGWIFRHALSAVLEQRVTGAEAIGAWQRMVRDHGDPVPAPPASSGLTALPSDMRVLPTPRTVAEIPSWEWHRRGVDAHRVRAVRTLAEAAASLARLDARASPGAVARGLAGLPGIGPWTVAETMQRSHGLPDAISVGDYHLAHGVCFALTGVRGDDTRMLELLDPWRGNRQRVVRMIGVAGPRESRKGPRVAPQAHRFF